MNWKNIKNLFKTNEQLYREKQLAGEYPLTIVETYHSNGKIQTMFTILGTKGSENPVKHGKYNQYDNTGCLVTECNYVEGLRQGDYQEVYEFKKRKITEKHSLAFDETIDRACERGTYKNGKKDGSFTINCSSASKIFGEYRNGLVWECATPILNEGYFGTFKEGRKYDGFHVFDDLSKDQGAMRTLYEKGIKVYRFIQTRSTRRETKYEYLYSYDGKDIDECLYHGIIYYWPDFGLGTCSDPDSIFALGEELCRVYNLNRESAFKRFDSGYYNPELVNERKERKAEFARQEAEKQALEAAKQDALREQEANELKSYNEAIRKSFL